MKAKTVRRKCLDCCGSAFEVKRCPCFECPLWECRFGREPETIRRRAPHLLDPIYVVIAGAICDEPESTWARQVLADPRSALGTKLDGRTKEQIATVVTAIKATPPGELFAGTVSGSTTTANIAEKPRDSSVRGRFGSQRWRGDKSVTESRYTPKYPP